MLFQDVFIQRILIIALFQTWPIVYDLYLAIKLIKRSKNPLTFIIATYFIMYPFAFILRYPSIFVIPISGNLAYFFYFIAWFIFILSQGFLVIFSWQLNKLSKPVNYKQTIPWIILNLIFSSFVIWAGFMCPLIFALVRYHGQAIFVVLRARYQSRFGYGLLAAKYTCLKTNPSWPRNAGSGAPIFDNR